MAAIEAVPQIGVRRLVPWLVAAVLLAHVATVGWRAIAWAMGARTEEEEQ